MARPTLAERLERLSMPEPNSGCTLWLGTISPKGYGYVWVARGYVRKKAASALLLSGLLGAGALAAARDVLAVVDPWFRWWLG